MRQIVVYRLLTFAVAVVLMAGCSSSPSPDVAEAKDNSEAEYDIVLPDSSEAINVFTGEKVGEPARVAVTSEKEPAPAEIADGADSDAPGGYQPVTADAAANSPREAPQPLDHEAVGDEATKGNERRSDGDDPEAPLLVAKIAEAQEDAPLNNGREDSAQPIPAGQRVAVAPRSVAPAAIDEGRDSNAEPGAKTPSPEKAKPTIKPAAAKREKLSDLPNSIQGLDKDGDGQLGLYEWPREKLAEFKTLDVNKDGFLTPAELVAGQKKLSDAESPPEDKAAESSKEEAKEKPATTDDSSQPDDAKAPAADTSDKTETPDTEAADTETSDTETSDTAADEAGNTDASSEDEKTEQGS